MEPRRFGVWLGRAAGLVAVALPLISAGCATLPADPAPAAVTHPLTLSDEDDFSQLIAQMTTDLNRHKAREMERRPKAAPATGTSRTRDRQFAERAKALFAPLSALSSIRLPVVGLRPEDLEDNWHAPRDGGRRWHTGIDIFAPRGRQIVAVTDGTVSYIGDQPKGGHCLWLTTESGVSFYYAHLDRWAPGIYEGMEVRSGDLLGFVGNTGNATHMPTHLHFAVNRDDGPIDPYPLLKNSIPTKQANARAALSGGFAK